MRAGLGTSRAPDAVTPHEADKQGDVVRVDRPLRARLRAVAFCNQRRAALSPIAEVLGDERDVV
eukprot:9471279-Pyramimonas_sp.AAC.1